MTAPPPQKSLLTRPVDQWVLIPVVAVVLLGVIWGMTLNLVQVERTIAERGAAASSLELAETYEAQVLRALREIDRTLRFVKYAYERAGGRVDLTALAAEGLLLPDLVFATSVVDAGGTVVAGTRTASTAAVAGRDYFESQRAPGAEIAVGRPERDAAGREWRLYFTRRLENSRGEFAGVVMVGVAASYFVSGYEPSKLGEAGVLGLLGTDGVFRARRSGEVLGAGEAADYGTVVTGTGDKPPAASLSPWDGVQRYTVARELFDFPLAVVVGLSRPEQMAGVEARARTYHGRGAAGSLVLVLLLAGLARMNWKAAEFRRRAEAALNLRNRAIESSVNAIVITRAADPALHIEYVNPAFERITGYPAAEVLGRDGAFLLGEDLEQAGVREIALGLREARESHAVLRNYRKDGSLFWNDFHIAPVRDERGRITHYVGVMNDVTEAKRYEEQLSHQAKFDALTGLANRNLLQDRLEQAIAGARRDGGVVAAAFLDLDNFKLVNDSLGHSRGDELLRTLAARLGEVVHEGDTVARLGGDEFVLVLHPRGAAAGSHEAEVTALLERLMIELARPVFLDDNRVSPTCSIGVSFYPQDGADAEILLRNADAAMYRAKELGRNRLQFFTADVHERIRKRMELESSLRRALERDEFELHYQPQVSLAQGGIIGAEALLRWRHPERGLIGPAQFIGFAEETGLIVPIGAWVLERACLQNRAWQDEGLSPIPVSVNMSARQCEQPDVEATVRRALAASGLEARWLELEITESLSMENPAASVPLLERLKATGVALALDDFGTGFSNLGYLRRFPVDRLKIDLSFVREITTDPGSLAISEAIITMSHSMNLHVVAEGVETEGQLRLLGARHCDSIQGYFFSPPVAADDFAQLLREGRRLGEGHIHRQREKHHAQAALS